MVVKPAQVTPLTAIHLVRLLEEAGVPAGVVNLVLGPGGRVGQALADSPDIDLISLTGGHEAGRALMAGAAVNFKKVALEMGGKSPNIVFDDADFETAVDNAVTAAFTHSGQVCSAGSRAIVQDTIYERFVTEVGRRADAIRLGHGTDEATETGALITADHRAKVEAFVAGAIAEGARLVAGGRRPTEPDLQAGFFYRPTVFADVDPACGSSARRSSGRSSPSSASRPRTRRSPSPTTRPTGWRARSGPPTPAVPSASRPGSATGRSGSTTTTPTCRRPSGAASSSPASAASWVRPASTSTARPSTSGRTRDPGPTGWFGG